MKKPSVAHPHYANVCELALNSDVLVICCALTDQTYHMIKKEVLSALGKQGFADEPNIPDDLFELNNVVMSPYRGVFTKESLWDSSELISGNLEAFFYNKTLLTQVE